jgi:hypothetical protein
MVKFSRVVLPVTGAVLCLLVTAPARASLIINPTFAANIASDPNAAQIEAAINSAISVYQSTFSDSITVNITFQEGGGLGSSTFNIYTFTYAQFYNALNGDTGKSADDTTALARLALDGLGSNPVNGISKNSTSVILKAPNAHALGLSCASQGCGANEGGTITLNTSLINPGSPGSSLTYNLVPVVQHEIDEILGLGSTLGLPLSSTLLTYPSAEDFFRYAANGTRSFTASSSATSFFSINGTTDLAQFNQNSSGDYGDWQSSPLPNGVAAQVQDAFATPGANPSLGVELRALDVIGYNRITPIAPEPGTMLLMGGGLLVAGFVRRRYKG